MVDVVIGCVVLKEHVEDITGQPKATVIIYSLDYSKAEKEHSSTWCHPCDQERHGATKGVKEETLQRVVVECSNCVRNNQAVMLGVNMTVQELVVVHVTVHKILPCIHY